MRASVPPSARGTVRQGGKEELRASVLKTYLLRIRTEKGERAAGQLLAAAGIDPGAVDNETGWVSQLAAKRALRAISALLGRDAIRHRGDWVTHPEALGVLVRMLRASERPVDAYRYLARARARGDARRHLGRSTRTRRAAKKAGAARVRMTYRPRADGGDDAGERATPRARSCLCDARVGELASMPRIWGLPDAEVTHETCLAKGARRASTTCAGRAALARGRRSSARLGAAVACGAAVGVAGGALAGALARGARRRARAAAPGFMWDRSREERAARAFERNRIAALERGLELRGETRRDARAISPAPCSAASTASDARSARAASASSTRRST